MATHLDGELLRIEGHCSVEDVLTLVQLLRDAPNAALDLSRCASLHSAAFPALVAARARIAAEPEDAHLARHLMPLLRASQAAS